MAIPHAGANSRVLPRVTFALRDQLLARLSAFVSYLKANHSDFCRSRFGCLLLPLLQRWSLSLRLSQNLSQIVDHWHRRRSPRRLPGRFPYLSLKSTPIHVLFRDPLLLLHLNLSPSGYPRPPLSVYRLAFLAALRLQGLLPRF